MLRLTLLPIILFLGLIVTIVFGFILYKKIKRGIALTYKKGVELASEQQQKWAQKEQRKKFPDILQKGFDRHEKLLLNLKQLPAEWQNAIQPLALQAKQILDQVALEATQEGASRNKKLNSIRPFFNHTLDALLQFTEKLLSDYQQMNPAQIEKARQNISIFEADILSHQETLKKASRMDFDVLMDVIKARLKK